MAREPLEGHDKWVLCVSFRKDGKLVVSGSSDKTIRVWDLRTGKCVVGPIKGHDDDVSTVVFSHDGLRIISHRILLFRSSTDSGVCTSSRM